MAEPDSMVFVVDDDPSILTCVKRLMLSVNQPVQTFGSLVDLIPELPPDDDMVACLVLDMCLPDESGLELQRDLLERQLTLPIIFTTGHGDVPTTVRALQRGAVAFLPKPFRGTDLLESVNLGLSLSRAARNDLTELQGLQSRLAALSRRERDVVDLVVRGLLNKQIAAELGISEVTVKIHRRQAMQKTGAGSVPELVRMIERIQTLFERGGHFGLRVPARRDFGTWTHDANLWQ